MTVPFTIEKALVDDKLLGSALGDIESWRVWLATRKPHSD